MRHIVTAAVCGGGVGCAIGSSIYAPYAWFPPWLVFGVCGVMASLAFYLTCRFVFWLLSAAFRSQWIRDQVWSCVIVGLVWTGLLLAMLKKPDMALLLLIVGVVSLPVAVLMAYGFLPSTPARNSSVEKGARDWMGNPLRRDDDEAKNA